MAQSTLALDFKLGFLVPFADKDRRALPSMSDNTRQSYPLCRRDQR